MFVCVVSPKSIKYQVLAFKNVTFRNKLFCKIRVLSGGCLIPSHHFQSESESVLTSSSKWAKLLLASIVYSKFNFKGSGGHFGFPVVFVVIVAPEIKWAS